MGVRYESSSFSQGNVSCKQILTSGPFKIGFGSAMARESSDYKLSPLSGWRLCLSEEKSKLHLTTDCPRCWGWPWGDHYPSEPATSPEGTAARSRHPKCGTQRDKTAVKVRHGAAQDRSVWDLGKAPNPYSLSSYTCNALQEFVF